MYKEKIVNVQTGEETWRDYSKEEIATVEAAQKAAAKELAELEKKQAARLVILEKLGLSKEEAKVLFS